MLARTFASPIALLSFVAAASGGCAPPTTYRTTSFVPAARPLAWDGRAGERGAIRVDASLSHVEVQTHAPDPNGGPALRVPNTLVEGSATIAPVDHFEIGVRAAAGFSGLATDAESEAAPVPGSPVLSGFGVEIRGTIPTHSHFAIGFAGNLMRYSVPYAQWIRTDDPAAPGGPSASCTPSSTCFQSLAGPYYKLNESGATSQLALNVGAYPSYAFGPHGELGWLVGYLGMHSAYTNDGFSDHPTSPLTQAGMIFTAGLGYAAKIDLVRLSAMAFVPLAGGNAPVTYGPGAMLTVGLDLPAFGEPREGPHEP
jgi:hypothetical protein